MQNVPQPEDGAIRLSYLVGEIRAYNLGPAFVEALVEVLLGAESLNLLRTQGLDSACIWKVMFATTTQRTKAAEQVLTRHGIALPPSD